MMDTTGTDGPDLLHWGGQTSVRIEGKAGDDSLIGGFGDDTLIGGGGDDFLGLKRFFTSGTLSSGSFDGSYLGGDPGNDLFDGGPGDDVFLLESSHADTLLGGDGDDRFLVVNYLGAAAVVNGGAGLDRVELASNADLGDIAFTSVEILQNNLDLGWLHASVEQIGGFDSIMGVIAFTLRGSGGELNLATRIGNGTFGGVNASALTSGLKLVLPDSAVWFSGAVPLDCRGITGSGHADTIVGGQGFDLIHGGGGNDVLIGDEGYDALSGNAGADDLRGGLGGDTLDGGADADTLTGGAGNDVYVVDSTADVIVEWADRGTDTMQVTTTGTWRIAANVENFSYRDAGSVTVTGNALDNSVLGGWGADMLSGWAGNDTLQGAAGRDRLYGNTGDDVLDGGLGADTLTGGLGADTFLLAAAPGANTIDTITDFSPLHDTIRLARSAFTALTTGPLASDALLVTTPGGLFQSPTAATRLIYDSAAGTLSYDADGSGALAPILIARLSPGLALTPGDFVVV
jgi:Ca2+-binding RTX toxin-like protein